VRPIGSPGQRNDIAFAAIWLRASATRHDRRQRLDADHLCDKIAETGGQPVIPPKRGRTIKRSFDVEL
jgi:putative transposase